jgi:hypothetical protein
MTSLSSTWRFLEPWVLRYFKWETARRLKALKRYLESQG